MVRMGGSKGNLCFHLILHLLFFFLWPFAWVFKRPLGSLLGISDGPFSPLDVEESIQAIHWGWRSGLKVFRSEQERVHWLGRGFWFLVATPSGLQKSFYFVLVWVQHAVRVYAHCLVRGRDEGDSELGRWQQNQPSQGF